MSTGLVSIGSYLMNNNLYNAKLHYQLGKLASITGPRACFSIFRHNNALLAETSLTLASTPLAVDDRGTVLAGNGGLNFTQAFTVYGFLAPPSAFTSLIGFNGEVKAFSDLYLLGNGHRAFSTTVMRFGAPDQLSPFGNGGINAYCYCQGDPVGKIDPSGRTPLIFKPFVNLKKRIQNRFFRKTPKKDRPNTQTQSQAYTPRQAPAPSTAEQDQIGVFFRGELIKSMARNEARLLSNLNQTKIEIAKHTDLTTLPPGVLDSNLRQYSANKSRIQHLKDEYNISPARTIPAIVTNIRTDTSTALLY